MTVSAWELAAAEFELLMNPAEPGSDVFDRLGYTPTPRQQTFHDAKEFDVLFGGAAGGGKGGRCPDRSAPNYDPSLETRVLTPKGFKLIGDIKHGDQVCNPDGTVARVIGVFDNGPKQFYRVTLADGSSVEADGDHLWAISVASLRKRRRRAAALIPDGLRPEDEWNLRTQVRARIVNTVALRRIVERADAQRAAGETPHYPLLPLTAPVCMTGARGRWERFSPYILGALIGDGSLGGLAPTICGVDGEIFDRIRAELPAGLELVEYAVGDRCPTYGFRRIGGGDGDSGVLGSFLARMRELRDARGFSQRDLASAAGMVQAYLSNIERGVVWPGFDAASRIDAALCGDGSLLSTYVPRAAESAFTLLKRDGLAGLKSWEKFVPDRIKTAPVADRYAFIQGLMDTGGHIDSRGHVEFVTVSECLARDVQGVLRSLGCKATMSTKIPAFDYGGERRCGRVAYRLHVRGLNMDRLFHVSRKRERATQYNGGNVEPWHRVVSVEPTVVDNSRCIQVDNLNHLYVTDDYIVTHNTRALVADDLRDAVRYPGIRIGAFRRTYGELKESLLAELAEFEFGRALGARWNGTEYELRFPNGSLIMYRYAESIKDATRRQGGQYQKLTFDERTLTPPDVVQFLQSRLRSGRWDLPVVGVRSGTNPGGPGHGAVKARYIEATDHGRIVVVDERGRSVRFVPSKLSDNPHVNPEYAQDLSGLDEKLRRAFLDGDWDVFAGQMFTEWRHDRHVLPPITLPLEWARYNGIDWGYAAPWCVLWVAVDEDRRVWVYRELYDTKVGEGDQARRILAAEGDGENVSSRFADDAMWATRGDAKPVADAYADHGVYLTPAGKGAGSRVAGWQRIHSYLGEAPACPHHRAMGWETCPRLHVFDTCTALIRTLPALPHAMTGNPEDADTTAEDHAPDALRYVLLNVDGGAQVWLDHMKELAASAAPVAAVDPDPLGAARNAMFRSQFS